jgi:3-deoxy-7-phosphoheptulonate synthase
MDDINIIDYKKLESPEYFRKKYPISEKSKETVDTTRKIIENILNGKDKRRIFIVGPCSIHNYDEAIEYAKKLKQISDLHKDKILILMRVFLEKPRTTLGWKGFINDPDLDSRFDINKGITLSRKLMNEINEIGLPVATEFLDVFVYPFLCDFVSWGSIGARTSESQTHRQMVSGFSMPVGFKNSTSGSIDGAVNAVKTAGNPHHFVGVNIDGKLSIVETKGNFHTHIILRGGYNGPNYEEEFVKESSARLSEAGLKDVLMIDCSHGNSLNDYKRQPEVFKDVVFQIKDNPKIIGLMIESYLNEGNQEIPEDISLLKKGVSVTDACISIKETEKLIKESYSVI